MSWPTGDTINPRFVSLRFIIPYSDWIAQALLGSTIELSSVFSWDEVGDILGSTAALVFRKAYFGAKVENLNVGQIVCFPADDMQYLNQNPSDGDSQWRKCEGQNLSTATYPELFAVIGYVFGGSGGSFNLPDMRGRVVVDAGVGAGLTPRVLGDEFGEEEHTLNISEMPTHSHSTGNSLLIATATPPPLDVLGPNPLPAYTGNEGGGLPHDNVQPSIALFYYIQVAP